MRVLLCAKELSREHTVDYSVAFWLLGLSVRKYMSSYTA
jgi:hypothetical protein